MSQQQFPLHQDTAPIWIHPRTADGEVANEVEEYCGHHQWLTLQQSYYPYGGAGLGAGYFQDNTSFPNLDITNTTNYAPPSQVYHQPLVVPFLAPQSSSPILIPNSHGPSVDSSPISSISSPSISASTSSSVGAVSPDVCRRAQPHFNKQTQQWSCGGCNKVFSDKYGTDRHIATVGLKVTCRYCGSRVSALDFSRRRHFRRQTCQREGIRRGFTARNEEDAFLEDI